MVHCETCSSRVHVPIEGVTLQVTAGRARGARYAFTCPTCTVPVSRKATRDDVVLLMRSGATAVLVPLEVLERGDTRPAQPLGEHDADAFADQLASCDELAMIAGLEEAGSG